ncbi:MAG: hypothetical protein JSU95_11290 [Betaproteobacteria bacterium]|nr:MAG: hypothetical protein JSU95_11290 [Betaproteobacteria bacterium]
MTTNRYVVPDTLVCVIATILLALFGARPVLAQTESNVMENKWQFSGALYAWIADMGGTTNRGSAVEVEFDDLLDALEFGFMAALEARKNRWLLFTDVIYYDLSADNTANLSVPIGPIQVPVTTSTKLDLKGWVVHLAGGYNLYSQNKTRLDVIGGARYLDLTMDLFLQLQSLGPGQSRTIKDSLTVWDGIIGLKGNTALAERWFLSYYADVGGGDSNLTWQASAAIGYKATRRLDLALGYRYLEWDLDSSKVIDDINISGPTLGLIFRW